MKNSWEYEEVHPFPKSNSPKVIVIARLDFELSNHDVAVQHVSHYATGTPFTGRSGDLYKKWDRLDHGTDATNKTGETAYEKTWTWLRKGNLKRETEFLLILITWHW